jgi:hypothetical protein
MGQHKVIVYVYIDDFLVTGNCKQSIEQFIIEFRKLTTTTEPEEDAHKLLGMQITRHKDKHLVLLRLTNRIEDLEAKYPDEAKKKRSVPMPVNGFIVTDTDIESLSERDKKFLNKDETLTYMSIVGCLIWIQGIRMDILFAVLYLSWYTQNPRYHHLKMAFCVIGYLTSTKDLPLVLGGDPTIRAIGYSDASFANGPKCRSTGGHFVTLNAKSGAVSAKAHAQQTTRMATFESELDEIATTMKTQARVRNILDELTIDYVKPTLLYNDNKAMIDFVHGEGTARGVRHMELRMWFVREHYQNGDVDLHYMPTEFLPADKLTKLAHSDDHQRFAKFILGHALLSDIASDI